MEPYVPHQLPLQSLDWITLIRPMVQANTELARYDGILQGIVNPDVLLSPLTTQEAVLSSKIEGTQATLEEVLEFEASEKFEGSKQGDIIEIINYRAAMRTAVKRLKERPISLNMLLEIHSILLDSVRGYDKARGRFRTIQNWIGRPGSTIEEAMYIPPEPQKLMEYLSNFEQYVHLNEKDRLVQLAIIHAQFEIIHPFLDGNGRLGRILIPLFLFEKGLLSSPMFYISAFLEANRSIYYDKLRAVTVEGKWEDWINFFLTAIIEQGKINNKKAKAILSLYDEMKIKIPEVIHSQFSIKALDTLFENPIFKTTDFITRSGIPKASAMRVIEALKKDGILSTVRESKGRTASILVFNELIVIIKE